jgi:hypothetical protein
MRIKYLNNSVEDHVDRNLGTSLIRAGLAVAVGPEESEATPFRLPKYQHPSAPAEPRWQIETVGISKKELVIRMSILGQVYYFSGNPASANKTVAWDGGSRFLNGFGRAIPKQILKAYREQWNANESLRGPEGDGSAAALWRASGVE